MASTYVNDLRLNEMATGDASGSWGTVTNTNLELIGEAFSYGTETIGDADSTLTIADGAADAARSFYLKITSSVDLTTTRIVTLGPNTVSKVWMIENATTGSQVITIKQGSGATINVPNGQVKMISTDGAGSGGAVLDLLVDVDLTGTTTLVNLNVSGAVDIAGDLTLSAGGDGALRFTAASSVKVLDNNAAALVFEEADNAYMTFVTTDGSEAVKFDKALDINAATQIDATVTVGVDDTGYDVKFFGATAGAYMLWDESADDLILGGAAGLSVNSTALVTGVLTTTAATVSNGGGQFNGEINVGVDDTGYDVKFFGATTGKSLLWDESADSLIVTGTTTLVGTTNLDAVDIDGATQIDATVTVGVDDTGYDVKFFGATAGKYMLWDESADTLEVSGTVAAAAGTALLPSITTTGDLNTGMWFPAADTIAFSEGGVEALRINSSGNVGIGSTVTTARANVWGANIPTGAGIISAHGQLAVYSTSTYGANIGGTLSLGGDGGTYQNVTYATVSGRKENASENNYDGYLAFAVSKDTLNTVAERLRIDSTGRVGIGRTPTISNSKLEVGGADDVSLINVEASGVTGGMGIGSTGLQFFHGSTARMTIDSTGAVTMPYQPAFLAQPASTQADISTGTAITVVFGTEVFDQNTDFASNTFTAPVTGKYQLSYSLYLEAIDTAASYYEIWLQTSNRIYASVIDPNFVSNLNYLTLTQSVLADMDVGDTAYVTIRQQLGTAQTDISVASFFSGYLVA
jgi:hypothetical protein